MADERPHPLSPLFIVQDEVRRLFQEIVHQSWGGGVSATLRSWQPRCDMAESDDALIVEVELPGVQRQDVQVEVEGDMLRITGERHLIVEHRKRRYHYTEQAYGRFARELRLPHSVGRDAIHANFHAGILTITLLKKALPSPSSPAEKKEVS